MTPMQAFLDTWCSDMCCVAAKCYSMLADSNWFWISNHSFIWCYRPGHWCAQEPQRMYSGSSKALRWALYPCKHKWACSQHINKRWSAAQPSYQLQIGLVTDAHCNHSTSAQCGPQSCMTTMQVDLGAWCSGTCCMCWLRQSADDGYPAHPKSSRDATDLLSDAHWDPVQRSDVYSTKASTSEYAQKISLMAQCAADSSWPSTQALWPMWTGLTCMSRDSLERWAHNLTKLNIHVPNECCIADYG